MMTNLALAWHRRNRTPGFTLTELAMVLGIVGLITAAIWSAASSVYQNRNTANAVQQLTTLVGRIRAMYPNGYAPASGSFTNFLIEANGAPGMIRSCTIGGSQFPDAGSTVNGQCLVTPWGNQVSAGSGSEGGGETTSLSHFGIVVWGMTNAQAVALIAGMLPATAAGLDWVYCDGVGAQNVTGSTAPTAFSTCTNNVVFDFTF
jgi:prepilin-type N-terminal cleavage/methylation domain-containing protein